MLNFSDWQILWIKRGNGWKTLAFVFSSSVYKTPFFFSTGRSKVQKEMFLFGIETPYLRGEIIVYSLCQPSENIAENVWTDTAFVPPSEIFRWVLGSFFTMDEKYSMTSWKCSATSSKGSGAFLKTFVSQFGNDRNQSAQVEIKLEISSSLSITLLGIALRNYILILLPQDLVNILYISSRQ